MQTFDEKIIVKCADGTVHRHSKPNDNQADWYRSDKGYHFMAAQVITNLEGLCVRISLIKGHNNDQGAFNYQSVRWFDFERLFFVGNGRYMDAASLKPM